jgi:hypothetical protein
MQSLLTLIRVDVMPRCSLLATKETKIRRIKSGRYERHGRFRYQVNCGSIGEKMQPKSVQYGYSNQRSKAEQSLANGLSLQEDFDPD